MSDFRFRDAVASDGPAIRAVVFAVLAEYGLAADPATTDSDLQDVAASYTTRGGIFRVLLSPADEIVGCGGLYPIDREEAEIRKMYFLKVARGHGLGRWLLQDLVEAARVLGYKRVRLETASVLKEAIALYRSFGFVAMAGRHLSNRCDQAYVLDLTVGSGGRPTVGEV